jgi:SAM-dependent methyltransferase
MDEGQWEQQRTSFGESAATYDSYRPDWPPPTAAWLTGTEPGGPFDGAGPLDVLDLGAGTGKLTRTLAAAGHRVVAADPSPGMLAVLARAVPGVRTVTAAAEDLPLPDRSLEAVTVAQAWHWLDQAAAARECARVLRPGGLLAIAWHLRDLGEEWVRELDAIAGQPEYRGLRPVQSRGQGVDLPAPFGRVESTTFAYPLALTPAGLAALASSWSYVAVRPDRDKTLRAVAELGRRVAGSADGPLSLPFTTYCYRARVEQEP